MDAMPVGHHVAVGLPHHVYERGVIVAVQGHVLRQLGAEAEVRHVQHAAPRPHPVHHMALRNGGLHKMKWKSPSWFHCYVKLFEACLSHMQKTASLA